MNFNIVGVVSFSVGVLFIFCAIKKLNPLDVVKDALQGKDPLAALNAPGKGVGGAVAKGAQAGAAGTALNNPGSAVGSAVAQAAQDAANPSKQPFK